MFNNNYIGIYWEESSVNLKLVVDQILKTLISISAIDPSMRQWYVTSKPLKKKDELPITIDTKEIGDLVKAGFVKDDEGSDVESLGFVFSLKSHIAFDQASTVTFSGGAVDSSNSVVVSFNNNVYEQLDLTSVIETFQDLIKIWKPSHAVISNLSDDVDAELNGYDLGRVNYFDIPYKDIRIDDFKNYEVLSIDSGVLLFRSDSVSPIEKG